MSRNIKNSNINNVSGNIFNGPTNIIAGNNQEDSTSRENICEYTAEPVWRSPITMALLTWLGTFIAILEIFPIYRILEPVILLVTKKNKDFYQNIQNPYIYILIFLVLSLSLVLILWMRNITKKETRYPLLFNYAISGMGKRILIEKIRISNCPECGGKMKYRNIPTETRDILYSDGKIKTEVVEKHPAFQCKRNSKHFILVDPAIKLR